MQELVLVDKKLSINKHLILSLLIVFVGIPLTIIGGIYLLDDRSFYFVSMGVLFLSMLPFVLLFEGRKPETKELVVISVLCAIGVAGRVAFFMLPQVKPIVAVVIISGIVFGSESGFLVGAMSAFLSNFFFGQGPWTPWQMFAMGLIGLMAGLLFKRGRLPRNKTVICIFGGIVTLIVYGGIINLGSALMWSSKFNWGILLSFYATGLPFDLVHAGGTVMFLALMAMPMIEKLERVQIKYGMVQR